MPEHLRSVVDSVGKNVSVTQKQELSHLVHDFQDIFAKDDTDLGCFSSTQHHIRTGEHRRFDSQRGEHHWDFKKRRRCTWKKLLYNGTVIPFNSERASVVVLVRKNMEVFAGASIIVK